MLQDDPLWYKDAVVYELHIKAFFDSNNDGIGDFRGLTEKLDYLSDLGVTVIWLLPFYPSPLKDDGYDIADYKNVNPAYGTMRDFRNFVREAHRRGLRVITELVINHTSDQHPWFQRARRTRPGSRYRDWYVWSDTDQKYQGTRIIFLDTEKSNWAWDPDAHAYYWHRFYSHQPDLNFDNPQVVKAVRRVMQFWLDAGVDGLRLDAVPYLIEREGTNNENLRETHEVLKRLRAELDARYNGRMFLAEANQWPEDVLPYFGDGDECHMAFHFPLMPRIFMAIAQEDRHPITDIMRQTPEIPDACQWAIFLRNHDELTLEMVTDRERDYLWSTYAADPLMRLNLGIRRRLAPLMDNDRRKMELLNSLLMSMPGTPILYYGDEIGMGDNIFLGDRDGVRTPMQWTPDRNAGFSRCDPARLYLPPIMDPVYGYEAVNVEAQSRSPSSLLNWMKRLVAVRQARKAFGRGSLNFLYPGNRRILAYLREYDDETVLCVANMARSAQAVELNLSHYKGRVPVELLGRSTFPPIGELPYLLTVPGHGFYWFVLAEEAQVPSWHESVPEPLPEFVTLVLPQGWTSLTAGRTRAMLERDALASYLPGQRWFAAKDARIARIEMVNHAVLIDDPGWLFALFEVAFSTDEPPHTYFVPLAVSWDTGLTDKLPFTIGEVRIGPRKGFLYDAPADEHYALALLRGMREGERVSAASGAAVFSRTTALEEVALSEPPNVRRLSGEQSNTSVLIDDRVILKTYRRVQKGVHPEIEIGRFLTEVAGFANSPALIGAVELEEDGETTALAVAHAYVPNQGDGWQWTLQYLERFLEEALLLPEKEVEAREESHAMYAATLAQLGIRTAEVHRAFATPTDDPTFAAESVTKRDLEAWKRRVVDQAERAYAAIRQAYDGTGERARPLIETLLARRDEVFHRLDGLLPARVRASKTRYHGDYHLGQVIVAKNDFYIIDFEGEPARPIAERRLKHSPLKDVAGMLRSFDYAAWSALKKVTEDRPQDFDTLVPWAKDWRDRVVEAFLAAYYDTMAGCRSCPANDEEARALLNLFMLEKGFYEIVYELANRPQWVDIPLRGVIDLLFPQERVGSDEQSG